jgi:hypothetical protein
LLLVAFKEKLNADVAVIQRKATTLLQIASSGCYGSEEANRQSMLRYLIVI